MSPLRCASIVLVAAVFLSPLTTAWAQDVDAAPEAAADKSEATEEDSPEVSRNGDTIHFKSGTTMSGVQVLRGTPTYYEVELVEGVDTLKIPRRQVDHVEYDDIDPLRERRRRAREQEREAELLMALGKEISPDLMSKLTTPIREPQLNIHEGDLVQILQDVAKRFEITIQIHRSVRTIPPPQRKWTLQSTGDNTPLDILREKLTEQFPNLVIDFQFDKILVQTLAAKELGAEEADPLPE